MPFIEELLQRREFVVKWYPTRSQVIEYRVIEGERVVVGCVFRGSEADCNKYVGAQISGLALVDGRVVDSKLAGVFNRSLEQVGVL